MSTAFNNSTITTTPTVVYSPTVDGRCRSFRIANRSGGSNTLLVNVAGLHAVGEFIGIESGAVPVIFDAGPLNIGVITAKSDSGTVTADGGIVSK